MKGVCWPTVSEASNAYYSGIPQSITPGNPTTIFQYFLDSGVWYAQLATIDNTGLKTVAYTIEAPAISFDSCSAIDTPSQRLADGIELGWLVAGAMLAAFSFAVLKRAL